MRQDLVIPLELAAGRREEVGGKAAALALCLDAGLPTVPGVVVLSVAFHRAAEAAGLDLTNPGEGSFANRVAALELPEEVRQALDVALDALLRTEGVARLPQAGSPVFAVRSSSPEEDGATHSFAGQFESFLCIRREDLPKKIAAVWASAFSERVRAYRSERGIEWVEAKARPPAVLIQPMVAAEAAGVAFSADPVTGRRRVATVTGVWGLGLKVISGEAPADLWHVSRDGTVLDRSVAKKTRVQRMAAEISERKGDGEVAEGPEDAEVSVAAHASLGELFEVDADPVEAELPSLSDPQAVALARLTWRCEDLFGTPQDIEWALAGGRFWLLQSRPITALSSKPDPESERLLWDNSAIPEGIIGATTPLTFALARRVHELVLREFCRILGAPRDWIERSGEVFAGMLGFFRSRIYYNQDNWKRALEMLPGYKFNPSILKNLAGVRAALPERSAPGQDAPPGALARLLDLARMLRKAGALMWAHVRFDQAVSKFERQVEKVLAPGPVALERLDGPELLAQYRALEAMLRHWDVPILSEVLTRIFLALSRRACSKWLPEIGEGITARLIASDGVSASAEPARLIREMGATLAGREKLLRLWREGSVKEALAATAEIPELAEALRVYIERYGDRCHEELKLEAPNLSEDPTPLLRAVAGAAAVTPARDPVQARRLAEQEVFHLIRNRVVRSAILRYLLRQARRHLSIRETLRVRRARLFGQVRRIFKMLGKRLAAAGAVGSSEDIFFLTLDEIIGAVEGTGVCVGLAGVAASRKAEFQENLEGGAVPPDRFETVGLACEGRIEIPNGEESSDASRPESPRRDASRRGPLDSRRTEKRDECALFGIACSEGRVRARARIVLDPVRDAFEPGEILVARQTDPGWVMRLPAASGLLVERGSLLSHSAVVARELGIPAIVGIGNLLEKVKNGALIEMDGERGEVRLLDCSLDHRPR